MDQQPWLHDLEIIVEGPTTALSDGDGTMGAPATGWFVDDRRVLSRLDVRLGAQPSVPVARDSLGAGSRFLAVARHLGDDAPDPTVTVERTRTLGDGELCEVVVVSSRAADPVDTTLVVTLGGDGADIAAVKLGRANATPVLPATPGEGAQVASWADARHRTGVRCEPRPGSAEADADGVRLTWPVRLEQGERATVRIHVTAHRLAASSFDSRAGSALCDFEGTALEGAPEWGDLVRTNLADLRHLLQVDPASTAGLSAAAGAGDVFAGAGSPWYLTLFGRDSLWAARFLAPFSPALSRGTLRALARRQAGVADPDTAAEPGKILHEVRREAFAGHDMTLPPVYYGTVDATALWICLLHDAWRWGMDLQDVRALLPELRAALGWLAASAGSEDGLLRYVDASGNGLANQGWKDSGDSMRRADGSIAPAPIALVEAQGYGVEAALGAAAILDALGEDGAATWRVFARDLAERIRERFWVRDDAGPYLAMAIDGEGRPVDGVGSNMGHLLGTGALTQEESAVVAARLMRPDMLRDFGIATLSADNPAYNPVGYHTGSVWTHDTAVVLRGLHIAGFRAEADEVVRRLGRLSAALRHRFAELVAGDAVGRMPAPYPASCRPQAWAAASAGPIVAALVGLETPARAGEGPVLSAPSALLAPGWTLRGVRAGGSQPLLRG